MIDRTRLQIIRADDMVTKTMDRVEEATETVHRTVISPIRKISGLYSGIDGWARISDGQQAPRRAGAVPQDEMFI